MIFYLTPPKVIVDLRNFQQCCTSRLKYFLFADSNADNQNDVMEFLIPGTKLDKIGHFVLRCFCLNRPDVTNYILQKETKLFLYRLNKFTVKEVRKCCQKTLQEDFLQTKSFADTSNVLTGCAANSYFGSMLLSALKNILLKLTEKPFCEHFKNEDECSENCRRYNIEIPFQICSSLVRLRQLEMRRGSVSVPCSKWFKLLEEVFVHHFNVGLSMLSYSVMRVINADARWQSTFQVLYNMYKYHNGRPPPIQRTLISYRLIDEEKRHFPPCMSHLLNVLRENHRLTHTWRYNFSLFLKDIGLTLEDSLEFWKSEYSKRCSAGASCTHSWQQNERKYRYSIRHLYGLEGAKVERNSKSCQRIQTMQIGMRDEGGCPFVHLDDSTLLSTLSDAVKLNSSVVERITELKNSGKPCEACSLHMQFSSGFMREDSAIIENERFESPLAYYICQKSNANKSLNW